MCPEMSNSLYYMESQGPSLIGIVCTSIQKIWCEVALTDRDKNPSIDRQ